jgi:hypothetical protein
MIGNAHQSINGWWLEHEFYISIQLGILIPTDYIFFREIETTNQSFIARIECWNRTASNGRGAAT